jgi:hypothetical protein
MKQENSYIHVGKCWKIPLWILECVGNVRCPCRNARVGKFCQPSFLVLQHPPYVLECCISPCNSVRNHFPSSLRRFRILTMHHLPAFKEEVQVRNNQLCFVASTWHAVNKEEILVTPTRHNVNKEEYLMTPTWHAVIREECLVTPTWHPVN